MTNAPAPLSESDDRGAGPRPLSSAALAQIRDAAFAELSLLYPGTGIGDTWGLRREKARTNRLLRNVQRRQMEIGAEVHLERFAYEARRPLEQLIFEDQETRRRRMLETDLEFREEEAKANHARQIDIMREEHVLSEEAHEAAWKRRKEELNLLSDLDLDKEAIKIVAEEMRGSPTAKRIEATRMVNEEISRIRRNPDLSDDEKHLQVRTLIENLPIMLKQHRPEDV